ncbi:hypothetical protein [Novosphingopyxis sp. YJ-S2-01]|uniref:hypothetical protein n=1 Tax=Novosphingopyxis sp. YJ-S2-01 TaxID=2794021 RepID=UPI0018DDFA64|nr:hypothetical protein [Novosphingopyxis sp. YJ-S2-01]MBH9537513.1 hypothetical protein [Novosphingopyxis sp. YJ-S2-01]
MDSYFHGIKTEPRTERPEGLKERVAEAIRPFAEFAFRNVDDEGWTEYAPSSDRIRDWFGPSDFRAANKLLAELEPKPDPDLELAREVAGEWARDMVDQELIASACLAAIKRVREAS